MGAGLHAELERVRVHVFLDAQLLKKADVVELLNHRGQADETVANDEPRVAGLLLLFCNKESVNEVQGIASDVTEGHPDLLEVARELCLHVVDGDRVRGGPQELIDKDN